MYSKQNIVTVADHGPLRFKVPPAGHHSKFTKCSCGTSWMQIVDAYYKQPEEHKWRGNHESRGLELYKRHSLQGKLRAQYFERSKSWVGFQNVCIIASQIETKRGTKRPESHHFKETLGHMAISRYLQTNIVSIPCLHCGASGLNFQPLAKAMTCPTFMFSDIIYRGCQWHILKQSGSN